MANGRNSVIPAAFIIFRDGDKMLMLLRQNTGWSDGWHSIPAGHIEKGESPKSAAVREAKEEVGVEVAPEDMQLICVISHPDVAAPHQSDRVDYYFEAKSWTGEITNCEPDKCAKLDWISINDLPEKTVDTVKAFVNAMEAGDSYVDYGF